MTYTYKLIEKDKITTIITTVDDDENNINMVNTWNTKNNSSIK